MLERRKLLKALLLLAPFTALVSACRHHRTTDDEWEDPFKREGGGY